MKNALPWAKKLLIILLGNYMYSAAVAFFILPAGLITGGTSGMGILVKYFTGLPVSAFVLAFNAAMFLLGAFVLGRAFAMTTLVSSVAYPLFLSVNEALALRAGALSEDPMLCTVFAGLLIGAGIALVLQQGASTGGMDIPPLVLKKLSGVPVAASMYAFDVVILAAQMFTADRERVLYGILLVCLYTLVLEKLLTLGKNRVQLKIISEKYEQINEVILHRFDRGSTLFEVEGGYTRRETYAILTVITSRELFRITEAVKAIDPDAFIVIEQVREVSGRGFTARKKYG